MSLETCIQIGSPVFEHPLNLREYLICMYIRYIETTYLRLDGCGSSAQIKPHIKAHEMEAEVAAFEQTILDFADEYLNSGNKPKDEDVQSSSSSSSSSSSPGSISPTESIFSQDISEASSRSSLALTPEKKGSEARRPSFATRLSQRLITAVKGLGHTPAQKIVEEDICDAWKVEATMVDRSVKILPGVRRLISSIPDGRYAVATSGAKTYGKLFSTNSLVLTILTLLSTSLWCNDSRRHYSSSSHYHCR